MKSRMIISIVLAGMLVMSCAQDPGEANVGKSGSMQLVGEENFQQAITAAGFDKRDDATYVATGNDVWEVVSTGEQKLFRTLSYPVMKVRSSPDGNFVMCLTQRAAHFFERLYIHEDVDFNAPSGGAMIDGDFIAIGIVPDDEKGSIAAIGHVDASQQFAVSLFSASGKDVKKTFSDTVFARSMTYISTEQNVFGSIVGSKESIGLYLYGIPDRVIEVAASRHAAYHANGTDIGICTARELIFWDFEMKKITARTSLDALPTKLAWEPNEKDIIAVGFESGSIKRFTINRGKNTIEFLDTVNESDRHNGPIVELWWVKTDQGATLFSFGGTKMRSYRPEPAVQKGRIH